MLKKPYPYQQDIINQTIEFKGNTLIQLPTGGGKTLISYNIALELYSRYNQQILFIAPKINLMEQTLVAFKNSNPQKIHKNTPYDKTHPILVSTIQTASRRDLNPDVIIIDEIHYGFDGKMIEALIKDKPNIRIIGLSATPYDKNGKLLQGFDLILNKYDMKYMIENKYLVPLNSYTLVRQNLSNVKIVAGDYHISQLSKIVSNNNTILEIVKTSKEYIEKSKKTIVFAVDINHCELLTEAFLKEGFNTKSLHSNNDKDELEIIENFKKGYIKVLVSVLKLTTGFDVPDTDLAIIARPTKSQNLYKQMVGRVLRKAPNKVDATLLDCGNVIDELGEPLEPIKENFIYKEKVKQVCSSCSSENIKLKQKENKGYWECLDCGYIKEIERQNSYKCSACGKSYSHEGNFIIMQNKEYLKCECKSLTLISQYHGDEKFVEINSMNKYQNNNVVDNLVTIDNIVEILTEQQLKSLRSMKKSFEKLKNRDLSKESKNDFELQKFYDSLSEKEKIVLDKKLENLLDICIDIQNNDELDDFFNNLEFNKHSFILYFNIWRIFPKENYNFRESIAEKLDYTQNIKNLKSMIKLGFIDTDNLISLSYEYKLYNLAKLVIKEFKLKDFTNNLVSFPDFGDLYFEFDEKYFDNILPLINSIDIGKCFDIKSLYDEDDDDIFINNFYNTISDIQRIDAFIKKYNVKLLIYGRKNKISYLNYDEAKSSLAKKDIKKLENWKRFTLQDNFPIDMPKEPHIIYKEFWEGWDKWLNSKESVDEKTFTVFDENGWRIYKYFSYDDFIMYFKSKSKKYMPYEKAKSFINKQNLKSKEEWDRYKSSKDFPNNIPKSPDIYYDDICYLISDKEIKLWTNWNDWLGLGKQKKASKKATKTTSSNSIKTVSKKEIKITIETIVENSKNKLLEIISQAQINHPNDKLLLSNLNSNVLDFFDKIETDIIDEKYNKDKNKEIEKRVSNFENGIINKDLKFYK